MALWANVPGTLRATLGAIVKVPPLTFNASIVEFCVTLTGEFRFQLGEAGEEPLLSVPPANVRPPESSAAPMPAPVITRQPELTTTGAAIALSYTMSCKTAPLLRVTVVLGDRPRRTGSSPVCRR